MITVSNISDSLSTGDYIPEVCTDTICLIQILIFEKFMYKMKMKKKKVKMRCVRLPVRLNESTDAIANVLLLVAI